MLGTIVLDVLVIVQWCGCNRSGRVLPYDDEETGTTTKKRRRKKPKQKVIQTQTSPARQRSETHNSTILYQQSDPPPALLITDASPVPTPIDSSRSTQSPGPLPGAVDNDDPWARPYPDPTPSVSEPRTSHKKPVTVERVSPSSVDVTAVSRDTQPRQKKDLSSMLPDVSDGSRRPG